MGIRDGADNVAPNCASLGQPRVRPEGKEVPRDAIWHGKRSHVGIPRFLHDIKYCGGCGGKGNVGGSLRPPGGAAWDGVGGGRAQPDIYADDGRIGEREHIWVQDNLAVSVAMFRQIGLETNRDKTKALVCTPEYI